MILHVKCSDLMCASYRPDVQLLFVTHFYLTLSSGHDIWTVYYPDIMMVMFISSFINNSLYSEIGIHRYVQSVYMQFISPSPFFGV